MMPDGSTPTTDIVPTAENARAFRTALGQFATGVAVITVATADGPMGFTANSFSSLSLDPALVLWSIARSSQRFAHYAGATHYAIHILGQSHSDLPTRFARGGAGFAGLDWQANAEGVPVIPGTLARFDCQRHAAHDGGDHLIIVGRVLRLAHHNGAPLVFAQGKFGGFAD
jgi:flavin reductase (DIM6/NTAB) family NADH-FMN oxidoreductase RutF